MTANHDVDNLDERLFPQLSETPEEIEYELRAQEGSLWTGTRLVIGIAAFAFASLAFAYFYLRSSNNEDLWRPHDVTANSALGAAIFAMTVAAGALTVLGNRRRRQGFGADFQVAGWTVVLTGLAVVSLQIFELSQLSFYPGSSGYASCFTAWAVMNVALVLCATYWIETLLTRSLRLQRALAEEGARGAALPAERLFRANSDGCALFWEFVSLIALLFWLFFYVV